MRGDFKGKFIIIERVEGEPVCGGMDGDMLMRSNSQIKGDSVKQDLKDWHADLDWNVCGRI